MVFSINPHAVYMREYRKTEKAQKYNKKYVDYIESNLGDDK